VDLDTSLLDSSPPDGTELRQANAMLMRNINGASDLTSRTKLYTGRMARGFERLHTEKIIIVQERDAQRQLLEARKKRKTGERVMLQNKFVFSTPEVLKITMEAESSSAKKKRRAKVKHAVQATAISPEDDVHMEDSDIESEGSVIVVARLMRSSSSRVGFCAQALGLRTLRVNYVRYTAQSILSHPISSDATVNEVLEEYVARVRPSPYAKRPWADELETLKLFECSTEITVVYGCPDGPPYFGPGDPRRSTIRLALAFYRV
jgi:hypothetical protein